MRRMAPLAKLCRAESSRFHAANTVVLMLVSIKSTILHSALKAKGVSTSPFLMKNVICCQATRKNVHAIVIFQAPSPAPGTLHFLFCFLFIKKSFIYFGIKTVATFAYLTCRGSKKRNLKYNGKGVYLLQCVAESKT
jgi:hypothetical protein